ncbi:MAG TPA: hypothetical protein VGI03_04160 [Verrucomicrobiae bacterium]|jgi:hypothetical protein
MEHEQRDEQSLTSSGNEPIAESAIESAARYVATSTAADGQNHGGGKTFSASFHALMCWGEAFSLIREESEFPFLKQKPTGHGDEHEGWFDEASNRWYKATYANRFGVAWGHSGSATAGEYLNRLVLQNKYFGDDIQLVALVNCGQKLRVLTSQPHIVGEDAEYGEICLWLRGLGFRRLESNGAIAWYRDNDNLLVSDVHEGNVIRSVTGALFAIDINLINPDREMLDVVLSLLEPA